MRLKWKHVIREAHRQWARRLMMGGAFIRCRTRAVHWDDFGVTAWWNRVRGW